MQSGVVEEKIAMVGCGALQAAKNLAQNPNEVQIQSRFGPIFVNPQKAICFANGMPGIPGTISFCLTEMPNVKNDQFKLLQCVQDHALSFIVVPSASDNQLIEPFDIDDACLVNGMNKNDLLLLFIVSVHETAAGRRLSVNAKAPIFVDARNRAAIQYIFPNNNYEIQHFIS